MAESFGVRLRQQRERQLITLSAIAERTKISLSLLEGLERDDVSHWPTGIFRRSFIRGYAQVIGLEPDAIVREFLETYPDQGDDKTELCAAAAHASSGQRPPTRLQWLIASFFPSLIRIRTLVFQAAFAPTPDVLQTPLAPTPEIVAATLEVVAAPEPQTDLSGVAHLCTELTQVQALRDVVPLLGGAASLLDAVGLIVWVWDPRAAALTPALSHGYPEAVLAKLPRVRRDTDNATAAAFRSAQPRVVVGTDLASGALVVPLLTPAGCVGVLALELRHGGERRASVRALASIFAAQLATVVGVEHLAEAVNT